MNLSVLGAIILGLVAAWLTLLLVLWLIRPRGVGARELARLVPDILRLVRDLLVDRSTPRSVRVALVVLLVWLISPIDLVPEFIPVLGPLDDVIVAVVVLRYVRRRLGEDELDVLRRDELRSVVGEGTPFRGGQDGQARRPLEIVDEDRLVDVDRRLEGEIPELPEALLGPLEDVRRIGEEDAVLEAEVDVLPLRSDPGEIPDATLLRQRVGDPAPAGTH